MYEGNTLGLDLAKNVFHVYGVNAKGQTIVNRKLTRQSMIDYFVHLPSSVVAMEACASSLHWARRIEPLGHEVRRIPAQFTVAYRRGNKTDATDAAAICEAAQRPGMPFVPNKTQEQTDIQAIHRIRETLVGMRTALVNQLRGLLAENGLILPKGIAYIKNVPAMLDDQENGLSEMLRRLLAEQYEHIAYLNGQIARQEESLKRIAKENERCSMLMRVPGIGAICSTALFYASAQTDSRKCGRNFSSYIGLTPREHSSGGKQRLGKITKRGDPYIRKILIQGSRSAVCAIQRKPASENEPPIFKWVRRLSETKHINTVTVAFANKLCRIAFVILNHNIPYNPELFCAA